MITAAEVAMASRREQGLDETVDPVVLDQVAQVVARAVAPRPVTARPAARKASAA